jgi:hypothetical protein
MEDDPADIGPQATSEGASVCQTDAHWPASSSSCSRRVAPGSVVCVAIVPAVKAEGDEPLEKAAYEEERTFLGNGSLV